MDARAESRSSPPANQQDTQDNAFWPVTITTGAWLIALTVLLAIGSRLPEGQRWWIGTCAVGVISGVGGMIYIKRRAGRPRRAAARQAQQERQARPKHQARPKRQARPNHQAPGGHP